MRAGPTEQSKLAAIELSALRKRKEEQIESRVRKRGPTRAYVEEVGGELDKQRGWMAGRQQIYSNKRRALPYSLHITGRRGFRGKLPCTQ